MAVDFPNSPSVGDLYYVNGVPYQWTGTAWEILMYPASSYIHAATHASAGTDPVTIAQSQVSGLSTSLSNVSASISDLSASVASKASTADLSAHESDTTSVHGIANTATLISQTLIDAKGDLIVGTAADAVGRLPVGTDGYVLTASAAATGGLTWKVATAGATGGGTDQAFYENDITINTNYTITTNKNAGTFGPVSVANGVTVTVPNGSTWTVV